MNLKCRHEGDCYRHDGQPLFINNYRRNEHEQTQHDYQRPCTMCKLHPYTTPYSPINKRPRILDAIINTDKLAAENRAKKKAKVSTRLSVISLKPHTDIHPRNIHPRNRLRMDLCQWNHQLLLHHSHLSFFLILLTTDSVCLILERKYKRSTLP